MFDAIVLLGTYAGPVGAVFLALNVRCSKYGYVLFLLSSIIMAWYGYSLNNAPVFQQNALFTLINAVGVYRWVLAPRRVHWRDSMSSQTTIPR